MTFIVQPKKEGEEKICVCGVKLVGRLTDYQGEFPDYLQWQSKDIRKSHYTKEGDCKELVGIPSPHIQVDDIETNTVSTDITAENLLLDNILRCMTLIRESLEYMRDRK